MPYCNLAWRLRERVRRQPPFFLVIRHILCLSLTKRPFDTYTGRSVVVLSYENEIFLVSWVQRRAKFIEVQLAVHLFSTAKTTSQIKTLDLKVYLV